MASCASSPSLQGSSAPVDSAVGRALSRVATTLLHVGASRVPSGGRKPGRVEQVQAISLDRRSRADTGPHLGLSPVDVRELLGDLFGRVDEHVHEAVDGLTPELLVTAPEAGANTIGWLVWHLTRVQDHHVAELLGEEQVWTIGSWAPRFGLKPDPHNTGYGHGPDDVAGSPTRWRRCAGRLLHGRRGGDRRAARHRDAR